MILKQPQKNIFLKNKKILLSFLVVVLFLGVGVFVLFSIKQTTTPITRPYTILTLTYFDAGRRQIREWQLDKDKDKYEETNTWARVLVRSVDGGTVYQINRDNEPTKDVVSFIPLDDQANILSGNYFRKDITGDDSMEIFIKISDNASGLQEYEILRWDHNGTLQNLIIEGQKENPTWVEFDTIEYRNGRIYMTNHGSDSRSMMQYRQTIEKWGQAGNTLILEKGIRFKLNNDTEEENDCEIAEIDEKGEIIKFIDNKKNCNIWTDSFDKYFELISEEQKIRSIASEVIQALKNKDYHKFAALVHPTNQIAFNAATTLGAKLTRLEIIDHFTKKDNVDWGIADGSGITIEQPIDEFFRYYGDYSEAQISFNEIYRGGSTSPNSFISIYTNKPFLNYYFPYTSTYTDENGKEVPNEMTWQSLNLIFDKATDGQWYLIGIQQDQWSI